MQYGTKLGFCVTTIVPFKANLASAGFAGGDAVRRYRGGERHAEKGLREKDTGEHVKRGICDRIEESRREPVPDRRSY